jgi:hypothetical protein
MVPFEECHWLAQLEQGGRPAAVTKAAAMKLAVAATPLGMKGGGGGLRALLGFGVTLCGRTAFA